MDFLLFSPHIIGILTLIYTNKKYNWREIIWCTKTRKINGTRTSRCLLVHFKATHDFSLSDNNISQICYCGQISLQCAALNWSFSGNLTALVGGTIYFADDGILFLLKNSFNSNFFSQNTTIKTAIRKFSSVISIR